jgi:AraC-like DNA-binding protein
LSSPRADPIKLSFCGQEAMVNTHNAYVLSPSWAALLSDLGIDRLNVLRRAGLPEDLAARGSVVLPPKDFFGLWCAVDAEANDPALAVRIGQTISVEVFEPPIFAAICSPNLVIAAQRIAQHKPLIGPLRLEVRHDDAGLTLAYRWPDQAEPPPLLMLTELVIWVALARITTRHDVRPLHVTSPVLPAQPEPFEGYFGVPVEAGPRQEIRFAPVDAVRPLLTTNPQMWSFFEPELRRRLAELEAGASAAERVRSVLLEQLPAGQAAIELVARKLAVSPRTLQRRLSEEGTSFQDVLSQTREALARHYLGRSEFSAAEIAFLLGYEDPNSFYRAFRDWTGQTPERARAAMS